MLQLTVRRRGNPTWRTYSSVMVLFTLASASQLLASPDCNNTIGIPDFQKGTMAGETKTFEFENGLHLRRILQDEPQLSKNWLQRKWPKTDAFVWTTESGEEEHPLDMKNATYTWHWPISELGESWLSPAVADTRRVLLKVCQPDRLNQ